MEVRKEEMEAEEGMEVRRGSKRGKDDGKGEKEGGMKGRTGKSMEK